MTQAKSSDRVGFHPPPNQAPNQNEDGYFPEAVPGNPASTKDDVPRPISEINHVSGELTLSDMNKPMRILDGVTGATFPQSQQLKQRPQKATAWQGASNNSEKSLPVTQARTSMQHLPSHTGNKGSSQEARPQRSEGFASWQEARRTRLQQEENVLKLRNRI